MINQDKVGDIYSTKENTSINKFFFFIIFNQVTVTMEWFLLHWQKAHYNYWPEHKMNETKKAVVLTKFQYAEKFIK